MSPALRSLFACHHERPSRAARILAMLAVAALVGACDDTALLAGDRHVEGHVEEMIQEGLAQSVTVRPAALLDRNDIEVRSVLLNTGASPLSLTSRICGLDYGGSLGITEIPGLMRCLAYGGQSVLAAGDSLVVSDLVRVTSGPGRHVLQVRHSLAPEHWAHVPVSVRE